MSGPETQEDSQRRNSSKRGQSHVVGTVLMIGLTVIALGGLTAAVGGIVDDQTSRADVDRVSDDFADAIQPQSSTGYGSHEVTFTDGSIRTVERDLRVFNDSMLVARIEVDSLVYERDNYRVAANAGAIVRGSPGGAWLERDPPITAGEGVLIVGATQLNGTGTVGTNGGVTVTLRTNTTHERQSLGTDQYTVAIESDTPEAFREFADRFDSSFRVADLDGDGVESAVLEFDGSRQGYLVDHDMRLEVGDG